MALCGAVMPPPLQTASWLMVNPETKPYNRNASGFLTIKRKIQFFN